MKSELVDSCRSKSTELHSLPAVKGRACPCSPVARHSDPVEDFIATAPNQSWVTDREGRLGEGWGGLDLLVDDVSITRNRVAGLAMPFRISESRSSCVRYGERRIEIGLGPSSGRLRVEARRSASTLVEQRWPVDLLPARA